MAKLRDATLIILGALYLLTALIVFGLLAGADASLRWLTTQAPEWAWGLFLTGATALVMEAAYRLLT